MQQLVFDGFVRAMADPRFHDLLAEFYDHRGKVVVRERQHVDSAVTRLLDVLALVLGDQHAVHVADGDDDAAGDVAEAVACLDHVRDLITGPNFDDAVTVLFLLCRKVGCDDRQEEPESVLARVDDFLQLLGVGELVSVSSLWQNAATADLLGQRDQLWGATRDLMGAVAYQCQLSLPLDRNVIEAL